MWCKAMKRDPKLNPELSASSIRHVYGDHFDSSGSAPQPIEKEMQQQQSFSENM
ncbi:hypothetical protein AVEN_154073-1, partial [Araneus ventricosus]